MRLLQHLKATVMVMAMEVEVGMTTGQDAMLPVSIAATRK